MELDARDDQLCSSSSGTSRTFRRWSSTGRSSTLPRLRTREALADPAIEIMRRNGVTVDVVRAVDHVIAEGVQPDMTQFGARARRLARDPAQSDGRARSCCCSRRSGSARNHRSARASSSASTRAATCSTRRASTRYYGRVGGCIITGNEDGAKHCAMNILYSLQHLGYTIPPQADSCWLGEAGPGRATSIRGRAGPRTTSRTATQRSSRGT